MIPIPVITVYNETGTSAYGVLGGFTKFTMSDVFCGAGSLVLEVPKSVANATYIDTDSDRQLAVTIAGSEHDWWFVVDEDETSWISDDPNAELLKLTCRSLTALLEEALVVPSGGVGSTPARWDFAAATPGNIVKTLFDAAQARGVLQNITLLGNATQDAAAAAWPTTLTVSYVAGMNLLGVLTALRSAGLMEWRFKGRVLEIYKPLGGLSRTLDVTLRPARDVSAAPIVRSRRSIATAAFIKAAADANARVTQTLSGRRLREVYVYEPLTPGTANTANATLYLTSNADTETQITHELIDNDSAPTAWKDYRCGDHIITPASGAAVSRKRVRQIALEVDQSASKITLEMGELIKTATEETQQSIDRLLPGEGAVT